MKMLTEDPRWTADPGTGCWIWSGRIDRAGYGRLHRWLAHRLIYAELVGPIPEGMTIDHLCFNPPCVNPEHLRPLTLSENAQRQRSATKTHCSRGHEFTPENTYDGGSVRTGSRQCRACVRDAQARMRARKKAGVVGPRGAQPVVSR